MHQITTLASQKFRYVSRSRTSCVGYHLTDPASSMMPHQRLRMGGWESGSWSKRQRIVSMAAAPHPSTPNLIRPSAITHQKFKRFLSSRLHALESDFADCYFDAFSHKSFMHLVIICQSKFNFYILLKKRGFKVVGIYREYGEYKTEGIDNRKVGDGLPSDTCQQNASL